MQRIKILLVDDELPFLEASKLYLEKMALDFQVKIASSALKALELITKEPFDVIVADYQMPNMNGLELLTNIKRKDLPFIIFTGKGREEVVIQALNLGADFYLQKGGDPKSQFTELVNLIKKAVTKQQTDRSLRKSEREKSAILEGLTDHVIYYESANMQIIWANNAAIVSSQHPRDQVIGGFCYEIWQQRTEPCINCPVIKAFKTGEPHEKELTSPDGRAWNVKGSPVKNSKGEMIGCIEITREITAQKKMEKRLKEQRKFFQDLFEKGKGLIFISTFQENGTPGKFLFINDSACTTFGYSRKELRQLSVMDLLTFYDGDGVVLEKFINKTPGIFETQITTKQGKIIPVEMHTEFLTYQGERVILFTGRDVQKYRQLEEQVQAVQERLERAMKGGNLAWWEMDAVTGRVKCDDHKIQMLGYQPKEFPDPHYTDFTNLVHPDDHEQTMQAMKDHLSGKKDRYMVDYRIRAKDGKWLWLQDRGKITEYDENNKPKKVTGIVINITDQKETELALKKYQQQLKNERDELESFATLVAHDIRGMLQIISLYNEMADHKCQRSISKQVNKISHFLEKILFLAKQGEILGKKSEINLGELVSKITEKVQKLDPKIAIQIEELPTIMGAPLKIESVFDNILMNVVQHANATKVKVFSKELEREHLIFIHDNGEGIAESKQQEIIQSFEKKNYSSFGMQIIKKIMEAHNGRMKLESREGKGTTMILTFPK